MLALDDRTGFGVAEAIVQTIAAHDPELSDDAAVWEAFIGWTSRDRREYIEAVRKTKHSIFYYQLQELYEFSMERLAADDVPFKAGRVFAETVYEENIHRLLQVALASAGSFQDALVEVFRYYLFRYTGGRYLLESDVRADETVLTVSNPQPELALKYCEQYGLDPVRAFRNSFLFIAGAIEVLLARIVVGFEPRRVRVETPRGRGEIHVPITDADHFDFEAITQTLMGYIRSVETHRSEAAEDGRLESDLIIGSDLMRETWDRIRRASRSDEIVLLRGESGTGKSFIARKIHELSSRSDRPFIEVCLASDIGSDNMTQSDLFGHEKGAFTGAAGEKKGLFSLADGGTIFLDEIGDASAELQAKLLRVIESSSFKRLGGVHDLTVDVRVIAATNRDLEQMIEEGTFRRDLYYRLNVIPIELPPLRERAEDIPALASFLLARAARGKKQPANLDEGLASRLAAYSWPGNIRELDHAIKHAVAMTEAGEITPSDFPAPVRAALESPAEPAKASQETVTAREPSRRLIIDTEALKEAVRSTDVLAAAGSQSPHEIPAHIDHAKRAYLAVLIEEFGGDLSQIGRLWDRGSEKTLRRLIKHYGLAERLEAVRARSREPS